MASDSSKPSEVLDGDATKKTGHQKSLEVKHQDPNSPLYSVKSWNELGLPQSLLDGISKAGFSFPSKIQEIAVPTIIKYPKTHFVGQAHAGSGKTAAFTLGMLARLSESDNHPQGLVLCPSRELANQIGDVITQLNGSAGFKVTVLVKAGNTGSDPLTTQVIVGTPGSVSDAFRLKRFKPDLLKMIVVDEADQMMEPESGGRPNKLWTQIKPIIEKSKDAQLCLFSATFSPQVLEHVTKLVSTHGAAAGDTPKTNYNMVTLKMEELSLDQIHEFWLNCNREEKLQALKEIFKVATFGSTVVFVNTKAAAEQLYTSLKSDEFEVARLTGDVLPADRDMIIKNFRAGVFRVLICTDVLARGFDVAEITTVINYDLPRVPPKKGAEKPELRGNPDQYLHRIGRSGRFAADGAAVSLVCDVDDRNLLADINAALSGVDPTTKQAKRKRLIQKLTMDDVLPLQKTIDEIQSQSL